MIYRMRKARNGTGWDVINNVSRETIFEDEPESAAREIMNSLEAGMKEAA